MELFELGKLIKIREIGYPKWKNSSRELWDFHFLKGNP